MRDVLRLARGMAYEAAAADAPFGGGKTIPHHSDALRARGSLDAPDDVLSGGGMTQLAMERLGRGREETERRVRNIASTLASVYRMADAENIATNIAVDRQAERRLKSCRVAA